MPTRHRQGIHGTTLIELLVIVLILGVLATLSTSTFIAYRDRSRIATALSSSNAIRAALASYGVDRPGKIYPESIDSYDELFTLVNTHGGQLPSDEVSLGMTFEEYIALDHGGDGTFDTYTLNFRVNGVTTSRSGWCIMIEPGGTIKCDPV